MSARTQIARAFFASIMLPAVMLLVFNSVYNSHVHITPDGERIVHAHPFKHHPDTGDDQNHKHSQAEYALLSFIGHVEFNIAFLIALALLFIPRGQNLIIRDEHMAKVRLRAYRPVRAPPYC